MTNNTLPTLVGNASLLQQISGQRLSHAYIITGPVGSGRHTLARLLAQRLICRHPQGGKACGTCSDCRKLAAGIHPDVVLVAARGEDGKRFGVNEARALHSEAWIYPNESNRKIYLFENAGEMSEPVQNVLLKLVEEGPTYTAFLLLAEHNGQLLPTIRSRCEELKLTPVTMEQTMDFLHSRFPHMEEGRLQQAAADCGGILGNAIDSLERDTEDRAGMTLAVELCTALAGGQATALAAFMAQKEKSTRDQLIAMCQQSRRLIHGALRLSVGQPVYVEKQLCTQLSRLGNPALFRLDQVLQQAITRLEANAGSSVLLGWLVASMEALIQS